MPLQNNTKKLSEDTTGLMLENHHADISMFSETIIHNAIVNRMSSLSLQQAEDYQQYLALNPAEAKLLKSALSISYSAFYRNPLTFALLYQYVLPRIMAEKSKNKNQEIRIWSAGCASGQEAYSLAMIADDLKKKSHSDTWISIFATDNQASELEAARLGCYHTDEIKNLPQEFVDTYLTKSGDTYSVTEQVKQYVEFSDFDLLDSTTSAPPASIFGDFDLVMCCNVLFYYKPAFQKMMLEKFHRSLSDRGFLVTGEAETGIVSASAGFRHYMTPAAVFIKR